MEEWGCRDLFFFLIRPSCGGLPTFQKKFQIILWFKKRLVSPGVQGAVLTETWLSIEIIGLLEIRNR